MVRTHDFPSQILMLWLTQLHTKAPKDDVEANPACHPRAVGFHKLSLATALTY